MRKRTLFLIAAIAAAIAGGACADPKIVIAIRYARAEGTSLQK